MSCIFIVLALGAMECNAARILAFLPMGSYSHQNTYRPLFRELTKRGHNVTYVTSNPDSKPPYKQIVVRDLFLEDVADDLDLFEMGKMTWYEELQTFAASLDDTINNTLSNPEVQQLIHSTDIHFDLVLSEIMFFQHAYIAFGH